MSVYPVNVFFCFFFVHVDYSEERVAVLLNADLANTLGNLLQRVTAEKLNPACIRDEREKPMTTQQEQLESEWNKLYENKKDRALVNLLKNLTGGHYYDIAFAGSSSKTCLNPHRNSW